MGNHISNAVKTGTIGELLVQLRLLQFGVQSAPPLKDSGNDLIAVRGEAFRGIQVKTSTKNHFRVDRLPEHYHVVAFVNLLGDGNQIFLDNSNVWLIPREILEKEGMPKGMDEFLISAALVDELFSPGQME